MTVSFVLIEIDQSCSTLLQGGSNMWKILTFIFFAFFAAQVFANSNDAIKKTIEDQIAAFKLDDFETAFGFATPFLKERFGSAENFGKMVRNGYPMVWRPSKVIFLENELLYNEVFEVPDIDYTIPLGTASIKRSGTDITITSFSRGVRAAMEAAELLDKKNISAEVIDLRTLRPLDTDTIINSVKKTNRIVSVEEGWMSSGVGAEIISSITFSFFDFVFSEDVSFG